MGGRMPGGLYYLDFSGKYLLHEMSRLLKTHTHTHIVNEEIEIVIDTQLK